MTILDTVVLLYFLLTGRERLLLQMLGCPLNVPYVVFDPGEIELLESSHQRVELLSEMRQAIRHYEVRAESNELSNKQFQRLRTIDLLHQNGSIDPVALTPSETVLAANLQSRNRAKQLGITVPLGPGEAACVAIAHCRGWAIATDDSDALSALKALKNGGPFQYFRIRSLLIRARDEGLVTNDEANCIHSEMRAAGFWDCEMRLC